MAELAAGGSGSMQVFPGSLRSAGERAQQISRGMGELVPDAQACRPRVVEVSRGGG